MSHQYTRGGFSGRSPPSDGLYSHRNRHVGASKPFANEDRMVQGRGKHSHRISLGSGSKHLKDKPASNYVYRPKTPAPDAISNSLEARGSSVKQTESFEASELSFSEPDSKNLHLDVGESKPFSHDSFTTKDGMSQGRGKYSHHISPGSDSSHFYEKPTSSYDYLPQTQLPDVIPNSMDTGGSRIKQPECAASSVSVCGNDIHLLHVKSDSKNIHLDVRIQIGETPKKTEEDGSTSKPAFPGKVKVGHIRETPLRAKADTEDQASQEKSAKNLLGIGDSVHSVQREVDKPFDICPPKGGGLMLKPSLLAMNKQKRNDMKRSMEGQSQTVLRHGMVLLKNYLSLGDQVNIVKECRDLGLGPGGFYQPGYRDGARLYLKMMCLGKNWDPETSNYGDIRPTDGAKPPNIPAEFFHLVSKAIQDSRALIGKISRGRNIEAELPGMSPDICIANFYSTTGKLGLHQDKDESQESIDKGLPVVSFSIGDSAEFLYGDMRDVDNANKVVLESGDVLIFGGKSRRIFHGVASIIPDTAPKSLQEETNIGRGRLNLTFRQY